MARKSTSSVHVPVPSPQAVSPLERLARFALFAGALFALSWIWNQIGGVLFPVLTALLLAYLLSPLIAWLERKKLSRAGSIALVYGAFLALFVTAITVLYPIIAREVITVIDRFPALIDLIETRTIPWLRDAGVDVPTTAAGAMESYGESLKQAFPAFLNKAGSWAVTALTSTGSFLSGILNVVLIPILTFFFLKDFEIIRAFLADLIPAHNRERWTVSLERVDEAVGNWLRGQIEVALVLSLCYGTALSIAFAFSGLGAATGFAIGALTGVLNIIPYAGVGIGVFLSIALALLEWHGPGSLLAVSGAFVLVQVLDAYFITPHIVGQKVGLGTAAVITALLVGGGLFGIAGMLLAIPVAAALRALWPDLLEKYKSSRFYAGP